MVKGGVQLIEALNSIICVLVLTIVGFGISFEGGLNEHANLMVSLDLFINLPLLSIVRSLELSLSMNKEGSDFGVG